MKTVITISILTLMFTSCSVLNTLENPVICEEEGTCKYEPFMKDIIQEQMCVDNGEETKCTSYYQRSFT